MASTKRKRPYTRQDVLDIIINDSDGIGLECDSDMSDGSSDENISEHTSSSGPSRTVTYVQLENPDSQESDDDGAQRIPVRQRGRARAGGGNRARGDGRGNDPVRARGGGRSRGVGRARGSGHRRGVARARGGGRGRGNGDKEDIIQNILARNGVNYESQPYDWINPSTSDWLPEFSERRGVLVDTRLSNQWVTSSCSFLMRP